MWYRFCFIRRNAKIGRPIIVAGDSQQSGEMLRFFKEALWTFHNLFFSLASQMTGIRTGCPCWGSNVKKENDLAGSLKVRYFPGRGHWTLVCLFFIEFEAFYRNSWMVLAVVRPAGRNVQEGRYMSTWSHCLVYKYSKTNTLLVHTEREAG